MVIKAYLSGEQQGNGVQMCQQISHSLFSLTDWTEGKFNQEDKRDPFIVMPPSLFSLYQLITGLYSLARSLSVSLIFAVLLSVAVSCHFSVSLATWTITVRHKARANCTWLQNLCGHVGGVISLAQYFFLWIRPWDVADSGCMWCVIHGTASGQHPFFLWIHPWRFSIGGNVLKTENNLWIMGCINTSCPER